MTALWTFVAVANLMLVLASAGAIVLLSLVSVAAVAMAGMAVVRYGRRTAEPVPARVPARRG